MIILTYGKFLNGSKLLFSNKGKIKIYLLWLQYLMSMHAHGISAMSRPYSVRSMCLTHRHWSS